MAKRPGFTHSIQVVPKSTTGKSGIVTFFYTWNLIPKGMHKITEKSQLEALVGGTNPTMVETVGKMLKHCSAVLLHQGEDATPGVGEYLDAVVTTVGAGAGASEAFVDIKKDSVGYTASFTIGGVVVKTLRTVKTLEDLSVGLTKYIVVDGDLGADLVEGKITFVGGTNQSSGVEAYSKYLEALKQETVNMLVVPPGNQLVKESHALVEYLRDLDENEVYFLTTDAKTNSPYNFAVKQYALDMVSRKIESSCILAAHLCGLAPSESAIGHVVEEFSGVTPTLSNMEMENAIDEGYLSLRKTKEGKIRIDDDITSYVDIEGDVPECFRRGQSVRIVDSIIAKCRDLFVNTYLGKVQTSVDNAMMFKSDIVSILLDAQATEIISDVEADDVVVQVVNRNEFNVSLAIQTVEAVRKAHFTFNVR